MSTKKTRDLLEMTTSGDVAQPDTMLGGTATRTPDGTFSGRPYFKVDKDTFHNASRNIQFRTNHNWERHLPKDVADWIRSNKYSQKFYLNYDNLFLKLPR